MFKIYEFKHKTKKFNLKKSQKPKFIIANSDKKLFFFEKFSNF